jgi:MFS family permease
MTGSPPAVRPVGNRWNGWLITGLFVIAAALLFLLIYYALPANRHYGALIVIGIVALFLALGSYLAQSFSRQPTAQRGLAWGFMGMGFAILFISVGIGGSYGVSTTYVLLGLLLIVAVLIVSVALIGWRGRALQRTANREVPRAAWRNEPAPSAFAYAAANSPSVPEVPPPAGTAPAPSPPPRSP